MRNTQIYKIVYAGYAYTILKSVDRDLISETYIQ